MNPLLEKSHVPRHFDGIANSYDLLTSLNPGYKKHLRLSAARMNLRPDATILDLCCGTGTSTREIQKTYPRAQITALDGSQEMLTLATKKTSLANIKWIHGDATDPAASGANGPYDGILMAYGIRNVSDTALCLSRLVKLLRPGGTICFHEYSVADSKRSKLIWNLVSSAVIVPTSALVTRKPTLFQYLRQSVNDFPGVDAFENQLSRAGFVDVRTGPMDGWHVASFIRFSLAVRANWLWLLEVKTGWGQSQRLHPLASPYRVAVIGGGIAGLSAATVLSERGARTTVFEAETFLGGRAVLGRNAKQTDRLLPWSEGFMRFFVSTTTCGPYWLASTLACASLSRSTTTPSTGPMARRKPLPTCPIVPPFNVIALTRRTPTLSLRDLLKVGARSALEMLAFDPDRSYRVFDHMTAG